MSSPLAELTRASFESLLNQRFAVHAGPTPIELELIEVRSLGAASPPRREPFSLLFRGPAAPAFQQGTHEVRNATLGTLAIFIVPLGPSRGGMQYQVIFA